MLKKLIGKAVKAKGKRQEEQHAPQPQPAASTQYTGAAAPPAMNASRPRQDVNAAESYDEVPETDLVVAAKMVVLRRYRDRDEWGNLDDDYWTMDIRVIGWPEGSKELKARSPEDMVLKEDKEYGIEGVMYLDPGKQWTSTFFMIQRVKPLPDVHFEQVKEVMFEVEARVQALQDTYCVVSWQADDDYENTEYGQAAKICFGPKITMDQKKGILHRVCTIRGTMTSANPDDNTWICNKIVVNS